MSWLAAIPAPIRVVAGVVVCILLYRLLGDSPLLLALLAVALLALAGATLLYAAGTLRLDAVPLAGGLLRAVAGGVAPPRSQATAARIAPEEEKAPSGLSDQDRSRLVEEGRADLGALVGVDDALAAIESRLVDVARADVARGGGRNGSGAPALVVLFTGPPGVGKTTAARAVAKIFAGLGVSRSDAIVELREIDVLGAGFSSGGETVASRAEEALGGALLLDDADWLLESESYAASGAEAGLHLLKIATDHPDELLVLATMSERKATALLSDERHARWIRKLSVRSIPFESLQEPDLEQLVRAALSTRRLDIDADAERALNRLIADQRTVRGDQFDNARACRWIAEKLEEVTASDIVDAVEEGRADAARERIVRREHVQAVEEMFD